MCVICEHQAHQHSESGCQLTTCSCIKFEEKKSIKQETKQGQKSSTQNIREQTEKWGLNLEGFKKTTSPEVRQESNKDIQTSHSEIWDKVEANWKRIDELNDNGEYEKVDKELDTILEIKFENISAWIKKGHNYNNLEKYDEAIICFKTALILDNKEDKKINKKTYEILNFIAIAHRSKNNHEEAINFCKQSLKIKEDHIPAMTELSINYRDTKQYELAIKECKKILKIERNNVDALDDRGWNYEQLEKWDEAIESYKISKNIENKNPNDIYADTHLARCYLKKEDFEHAKILINNSKITENENAYSYEIRGKIHQGLEEYEEAIQNLDKEMALNEKERKVIFFELGYCHTNNGNTAIGLEYYKKYVEIYGLTTSVAQNIGFGLTEKGENDEAIEWYDKGLVLNSQHKGILNNKAKLLETLSKYDEAVECYNKILENEPEDFWILNSKGNTLVNAGKSIEGIEIFKQIQSANTTGDDPPKEMILNNIGWAMITQGEYQKGLEYVKDALKINPNKDYILDSKGKALRELKRFKEAIKLYEEKYKHSKNEKDRLWIGICLDVLGNLEDNTVEKEKYYQEAIKIYDSILQIIQDDAYVWYNKAISLTSIKKYKEAKKNILKAIEMNPNADVFWDQLGKISSNEVNYQQAIICYDKSLKIVTSAVILHKKANALYNMEKYEEAIDCYDKALEIEFNIERITDKGDTLHMMKEYEEAIDCYDKALEIEPKNYSANANKGNSLRANKQFDESLEYLDEGIKIDPNNFYSFDNKLMLYREWGKYDKALELNQQLLKTFPKEEESLLGHFVDTYKEIGEQHNIEKYKEKLRKLRDLK